MTTSELSAQERGDLRRYVEDQVEQGDFDAVWAAATAGSSRRSPVVWMVAAAAVAVLGLAASPLLRSVVDPADGGDAAALPLAASAESPWVEPVPLRFELVAPEPASRAAVKQATTSKAPWSVRWREAVARTSAAKQDHLELRMALVALHEGRLDEARTHAEDSVTPWGALVAAEVHLFDLEHEHARVLLTNLIDGPVSKDAWMLLRLLDQGPVGETFAEVAAGARLGVPSKAVCEHLVEIWAEGSVDQQGLFEELAPGEAARCEL